MHKVQAIYFVRTHVFVSIELLEQVVAHFKKKKEKGKADTPRGTNMMLTLHEPSNRKNISII